MLVDSSPYSSTSFSISDSNLTQDVASLAYVNEFPDSFCYSVFSSFSSGESGGLSLTSMVDFDIDSLTDSLMIWFIVFLS